MPSAGRRCCGWPDYRTFKAHGEDFLRTAAEIPIHTEVEEFPLADANRALNALKNDAIRGAAVLRVA